MSKRYSIAEEFATYNTMWEEITPQNLNLKEMTVPSLSEWLDSNGQKVTLNNKVASISNPASSTTNTSNTGDVYGWSIYVKGSTYYSKGGWLSADYSNGKLEGVVFSTPELAEAYAYDHLKELEDENELYDEDEEVVLDPDFFTIEVITYPQSDMNANVELLEWLDKNYEN